MKKLFNLLFTAILFSQFSYAQDKIEKVDFLLEYNLNDDIYHLSIIVKEGQAMGVAPRAIFNTQISIVTPSESNLIITEEVNPIRGNQNYEGTEPTQWSVSDYVHAPAADPDINIFSIVPILTPASFFNNVFEGDTILLFKFEVEDLDEGCEQMVFNYDETIHPGPNDSGMNGADYSNNMSIGGSAPVYNGYSFGMIYDEYVYIVADYDICSSDCVTISPINTQCYENFVSVLWNNGETENEITVCPDQDTDYTAVFTDIYGNEFDVTSKVTILPEDHIDCIVSNTSENIFDFEIYPNPVQWDLTIDSANPMSKIEIYSSTGNLVRNVSQMKTNKINVSDLSSGIYFIKVSGETKVGLQKFIKL